MSSRRQRNITLGGRYRQVSLYIIQMHGSQCLVLRNNRVHLRKVTHLLSPNRALATPKYRKYRSGGTIAPTKMEHTHDAGPSAYSRKQHLPLHQHSISTHWWCVSEWSWLSYRAPAWPCPYQSRRHGTTTRRRREITQCFKRTTHPCPQAAQMAQGLRHVTISL